MAERTSIREFRRDPVAYLEASFPARGDAFWLPGRQLCLAEPLLARAVLADDAGRYHEHSDFFFTRRGLFGPRASQVRIARPSRPFLRDHLKARASRLESAVASLAPVSLWPDAGNWLVYHHVADALLAPETPPTLRRTIDAVVARAVLAGARDRYSALRRAFFRRRVERELCREITRRRGLGRAEPTDLLDVIVAGAEPLADPRDLAEVFLSFLFAIAGSVGFVFGWSLYLLGTQPPTAAPAAAVVHEALRLWPVAWMLGRRPRDPHEVLGERVTPDDLVVVCPYLVHRHPRFWPEPTAFRPERWGSDSEDGSDPRAFLPFGWGPHACVAGSLSIDLVAELLTLLRERFELGVNVAANARPQVAAALAPPKFRLDLVPRSGAEGFRNPK